MGLYLLIPLSVVLVFIIGVIFWWSVRSGQYDDMEGPAYRVLLEDRDAPPPPPEKPVQNDPAEAPATPTIKHLKPGAGASQRVDETDVDAEK